MNKNQLRELYLSKRNDLSDEEYKNNSKSIVDLFLDHFILNPGTIIHTYLSSAENKEVDTWNLIKELEKIGSKICVPKICRNELKNCFLNINIILEKNKWNILEPEVCEEINPENIEIIILPALICDSKGYRVGYGKGYYDRFLKHCNEDVIKVVLSFFDPIHKINDIKNFDIPVDYCITPTKIINYFRN